jgi:hypothetical protein
LFPFSPIFLLEVGYKISVDSRLPFGANQNMKNELAHIYKLYKSMRVNIQIANGYVLRNNIRQVKKKN